MPKIVDKTSKRIEIAQKTMSLFARKGFVNTSIREITKEVGMGKGTFYDYFSDKKDLLNETAKVLFSQWGQHVISKIENIEDPIKKLQVILQEGASFGKEFEQLIVLYIDIWRISSTDGYNEFINIFKSFLHKSKVLVMDIVDEAKKRNSIRKDVDSKVIATSFMAIIDGLCLHYMILKSEIDLNAISKDFFQSLLKGIQ